MASAIICVGDTTSHGGKVLEGNPTASIDGRPIAGVGHKVFCPLCKGEFAILPDLLGRRYPHVIDNRDTAVAGMRTACGAVLIASQSSDTITDTGDGAPMHDAGAAVAAAAAATSTAPLSPTLCLECLQAAAESGATTVMRG
ncbi:MAG TPA: PAAR domain-containing protein [Trinickia sp.]